MITTELVAAIAAGAVVLAALVLTLRLRRREAADTRALEEAREKNLHVPQSLHPVIDPDICIGSFSCIDACPEGDILGIVDGKSALITAANCIGHGKCALECPVGAIRLVFGTSERGVDLPEIDEYFESSRRGVHVVGELGGMGLIKNALTQGLEVSEAIAGRLNGTRGAKGAVDVAIVGGGPAGLATAVGCASHGLSFRVLEQDSLGGTIAHYPRQKVVMTETVDLPGYGRFGKRLISKEELLGTLQKVISRTGVAVEEGVKVGGIEGRDGAFLVQTNKGPVAARKVVLATGRRGSPRKLGAEGEELDKVSYRLIDPEQYDGCKVLVVGGGDSALEAVIQLANQSSAEVSLSYRGEALGKCREANRKRIEELVQSKRIRAFLPSVVKRIEPNRVVLDVGGRLGSLSNDYVIVNVGGEVPVEFLKSVGVGMRRYTGQALGEAAPPPTKHVHPHQPVAPVVERGSAKDRDEDAKRRRLAILLFALGAAIIAYLASVGWDYYLLPVNERLKHAGHKELRPAGVWGHGVGIAATLVMLSNFLYAVRKRWKRLKGAASIRSWLTFHMFVGFMSPLVIAFHAAFQSRNLIATGTAAALLVVVGTGIFGRFIFGLVPTRHGHTLEFAELSEQYERMKAQVMPLLAGVSQRSSVESALKEVTVAPPGGSLIGLLVSAPFTALHRRMQVRRVRKLFPTRAQYREFRELFRRLARMRDQVGFYRSLKRLFSVWRVFHVVLAVFLVLVIAAHIGVSMYLGYGWILF